MLLTGCDQSPKTDKEYLILATQAQHNGELKDAVIHTKSALQLNPDNPSARFLLASIYLELGNAIQSEKELRWLAQHHELNPDTMVLLGRALLAQRKFKAIIDEVVIKPDLTDAVAAEFFALRSQAFLGLIDLNNAQMMVTQGLDRHPESIPALLASVQLALVMKQYSKVDSMLKTALALNPKHPQTLLLRGQVLLHNAQYKEAQAVYTTILENQPPGFVSTWSQQGKLGLVKALLGQNLDTEAYTHIEELYTSQPQHLISNYLMGLYAYRKGEFEQSKEYLLQVVRENLDHKPTVLLLGAVDYAVGNFEQAEMYLRNFLATYPQHVQASKLLGATRLKIQDPAGALETLSKVVNPNSADAQLLKLISQAALRSGNYELARSYLVQAQAKGASGEDTKTQIAKTHLVEGNLELAIGILESIADDEIATVRSEGLRVLSYIHANDLDAAEQTALDLVKKWPESASSHNVLAGVLLARQRLDEARNELDMALLIDSEYIPSLTNSARLHLLQGNQKEASVIFLKVLEIEPNHTKTMVALGQLNAKQGNFDQAIEWMEKARKTDASALQPRMVLCRHYLRRKRYAEAYAVASEAQSIAPDNPAILVILGQAQFATKRFAKAQETFERRLELEPDIPEAYLNLGQFHVHRKNFDQARALLEKGLQLQRNYYPANEALALLELQTGNFDAAMDIAEQLITHYPRSAASFMLKGDLLSKQKSYKKALLAYETAFKLETNSGLLVKYSQMLIKVQRAQESMKLLHNWLQAHPEDQLIRLELATVLKNSEEIPAAIKIYQEVLNHQPHQLVALNNLALAYLSIRDAKALETAKRAYAVAPTDPAVQDTLGWVMVQQGEAHAGLEYLQQAANSAPKEPEIKYHLAKALAITGQETRAKAILNALIQEYESFTGRTDAQLLLGNLNTQSDAPKPR